MSGPSTVVYSTASHAASGLDAMSIAANAMIGMAGLSAVMLAARAIRESHDIYMEYGEALDRVCEREKARNQQRRQLQEAKCRHIASLHRQADRLQARLSRLHDFLHKQEADTLQPPVAQDERSWNDYLGKLEAEIRSLEKQLPTEEGVSEKPMILAEQTDINQILTAYARTLHGRLASDEAAHYHRLSQRLLSRLELEAGEALPYRIEPLAREMFHAHDAARAEALATDLRLEILRSNQNRKQQKADAGEATMLLAQLADDLPDELRIALEQVAAGVCLLDEQTRTIAKAALENVRASRQKEEQEAISLVLDQSLRDLGYEVEGISQTLFVSGGVVHFQKQAWQNYHVRMRVNAADNTINFNVVRARGSGDAAINKRQDYLAEDRWCAEFPALLKTLEARGVKLDIARMLQAGEVPVQVVDAATLPLMKEDEENWRAAAAKQMKIDRRL